MVEGRCMKCKEQREFKDPVAGKTARGGDCIKGTCSVCGTKMFKFGKLEAQPEQQAA